MIFLRDYSLLLSEAKYQKGFKMVTPKKMLQRFPTILAWVKAGNTSENLLNEIKRIIYSCIKQKKLLKKYKTI